MTPDVASDLLSLIFMKKHLLPIFVLSVILISILTARADEVGSSTGSQIEDPAAKASKAWEANVEFSKRVARFYRETPGALFDPMAGQIYRQGGMDYYSDGKALAGIEMSPATEVELKKIRSYYYVIDQSRSSITFPLKDGNSATYKITDGLKDEFLNKKDKAKLNALILTIYRTDLNKESPADAPRYVMDGEVCYRVNAKGEKISLAEVFHCKGLPVPTDLDAVAPSDGTAGK